MQPSPAVAEALSRVCVVVSTFCLTFGSRTVLGDKVKSGMEVSKYRPFWLGEDFANRGRGGDITPLAERRILLSRRAKRKWFFPPLYMTEQVGISVRIVASLCCRRVFVRLNVSPSRTVAFIISRNAAFMFASSETKCRRLEAEMPRKNRGIGFDGVDWHVEVKYIV